MERDELSFAVIGAAMQVHRALGPGFLESVYEKAMCVELGRRSLPFVCQHRFDLTYEGILVGEGRVDLLVDNQLIIELKAIEAIAPIHKQQLLSYLKATSIELGLLINFNVAILKDGIHRIIHSRPVSAPS